MNFILRLLLTVSLFVVCSPPMKARADETVRRSDPNKYAVIISGAGGEEAYVKQFAAWSDELRRTLVEKLNFAPEQVYVLNEKPAGTAKLANAAEVRQTFAALQKTVGADKTVYIFLIGHGTFDGQQAKFNIVGPDLPAAEYREMFGALSARRSIVVNMASASGEFIKPLAAPNRVLITATRSGQEQNATRFPAHFIAALSDADADADKNNRISVLEAFAHATKKVSDTFKTAGNLAAEHALLDDNGDGVGHQTAEAGDGALARATYFDSVEQIDIANNHQAAKLIAERGRVEDSIGNLKRRKETMPLDSYYAELEQLFISLAKINRELKMSGDNQQK